MKILTANELLSGATVYLFADGRWEQDLQSCRVFSDEEEAQLTELSAQAAKTGRLVSIEAEEVEVTDGVIRPLRLRERIRAEGPTTPRHAIQQIEEGDHVSL